MKQAELFAAAIILAAALSQALLACDDSASNENPTLIDADAADVSTEDASADPDVTELDVSDDPDVLDPDVVPDSDVVDADLSVFEDILSDTPADLLTGDLALDDGIVADFPCTATESDIICVGAASRSLTPPRYEVVNPAYLAEENTPNDPHACFNTDLAPRCGVLSVKMLDDCGTDGLCDTDEGYPGPDQDGSEGDDAPDWFFDCGMDRICPDSAEYTGPDDDGSEANGKFDGFWIAGFSLNRPMAGVMDDIWAHALVLHHDGATVGFFVADLVGFHHDQFERVRARYRELYPDDRVDYLMMQSTHVHEVPDTMGLWGPTNPSTGIPKESGIVDWWLDWIIDQMALAVHEAYVAQQRAELWVGSALTGVENALRDSRPPIVFDDELKTMQFRAEGDGQVIATALHWANHPEALWSDNNFQSSDFAHYARAFVGDGLPARGDQPAVTGVGGTVMYLQGAIGGLLTPPSQTAFRDGTPVTHRGPEMAEAMGERLALATFEALESAERITDFDGIRWVNRVHYLVVDNVKFHIANLGGLFGGRDFYLTNGEPYPSAFPSPGTPAALRTEQAIVRFGPSMTWYTYPGELFPELAFGGYDGSLVCGRAGATECDTEVVPANQENPPRLDEAPAGPYTDDIVPGRFRFLLGLAMDEVGYIVPSYDFELDSEAPYFDQAPGRHYEETNSVGPASDTTDQIIRELALEAAGLY